MNKEQYYNQTDKQRITNLQRHIMKMEDTINGQSKEIVRLTLEQEHPNSYMIDTLKTCHDILVCSNQYEGENCHYEKGESLRKDLRKVISFLQQ